MNDLLSDFCTVCKQKQSSVNVMSPYLSRKGMFGSLSLSSAQMTLLMMAVMSSRCLMFSMLCVKIDCHAVKTVCTSCKVFLSDFGRLTPALIASIMHLNTDSASLVDFRAFAAPTSVVFAASRACFTRAFKLSNERFHSFFTFLHSSCFLTMISVSWGRTRCAASPSLLSGFTLIPRSVVFVCCTASSKSSIFPLTIAFWSSSRQVVTSDARWQIASICSFVFS
mmetsp:Transcript_124613/g.311666  ORF Transcript_124613/g.311666 Transcript_124613/m.311666 type:complete len:224 (-) Transcript_124613:594-1265(-)